MWRSMLVLAIGCNQVYELEATKQRDASMPLDTDGDGVIDLDDNCPQVANDQGDVDGDLRGDLCDDCPLVVNPTSTDADGDTIGDVCDPHPKTHDCLLILDSFRDPAAFAANWTVALKDDSTVVPQAGYLDIRPARSGSTLVITATGTTGRHDVMIAGTLLGQDATIEAVSNHESANRYYGCRVQDPNFVAVYGPGTFVQPIASLVPPNPLKQTFVVRLLTDRSAIPAAVDVSCRVDYGFSVGTQVREGCEEVAVGGAGIYAAEARSTVDAIAIYQQLATCPATIYR